MTVDSLHGVIEEDCHGLRHGGAGGGVSGLGRRRALHRVDPQLGGHVLQGGLLSFGESHLDGVWLKRVAKKYFLCFIKAGTLLVIGLVNFLQMPP